MALQAILERLGHFQFTGSRTVWCLAETPSQLTAAAPLFAALLGRVGRIEMALSARGVALEALPTGLPDCHAVPLPWPLKFVALRFLLRLNTKMLVFIGLPRSEDQSLMAAARKRGLPIVVLDPLCFEQTAQPAKAPGANQAGSGTVGPWLNAVEHFYVAEEGLAPVLTGFGLSHDRMTMTMAGRRGEIGSVLPSLADSLRAYLTRDLKLLRGESRHFRRMFESLLLTGMGKAWLAPIMGLRFQRVGSLEDLRRQLGQPKTLLCLGNGPSSEDPRLVEIDHDALFRVNHRWRERDFLAMPDVVFTGSKESVTLLSKVTFGFLSVPSEGRMLKFWLFSPHLRKLRYLTVERFGLFLHREEWRDMRPTNGASMLATAVALQPERLVISGFDLFSHPKGSYPGDVATPNAYAPGHDRDRELEALLHALGLYGGELVILSAALEEAWARHRQGDKT